MGILEGKKQVKTQLYFRDDHKFQFIKRPLENTCLVERNKGELYMAWKHFFSNQYFFPGYKSISADNITISCGRDIILDPFKKVPLGEQVSQKPNPDSNESIKRWIAKIAENQRHIYKTERKSTLKDDVINYCLIGVLGIMAIAWLIGYAASLY